MFGQRHSAYRAARDLLWHLSRDLERAEDALLSEAIGDLFFSDDPIEAVQAFEIAEQTIARLAHTGRLDTRAANTLLIAIAGAGPDPVAAL